MATSTTRFGSGSCFLEYEEVIRQMSCHDKPILSTACYLCFSSGHETTVVDKDLKTARLSPSHDFIVVTNADARSMGDGRSEEEGSEPRSYDSKTALEELIKDANERKECAEQNYCKFCRRRARTWRRESFESQLPTVDDIVTLVQEYPTTDECTHFAAVMDPLEGRIARCRYWREPIEDF